jgi:hypothetical protein
MNTNSNPFLIKAVLFLEKIKLLSPKRLSKLWYYWKLKKKLNFKNPQDLNEKILYLLHNTDISKWTELSDKYKVRKYIEKCGLGHLLVKLYGVYSTADEIDFESLPQSFVLKTNNGCGTVMLVEDKNQLNIEKTKKTLNRWLKIPFGIMSAEFHYRKIKPCIIAEEYLKEENAVSTSLIDYKIWCFDGQPTFALVCYDRDISKHCVKLDLYEAETWEAKKEYLTGKYRNDIIIPKPQHLEKMIEYAKILSKGFPQIRVDFYEVNGKIYIGELTFTSYGGIMPYFTDECLKIMGDKVTLP